MRVWVKVGEQKTRINGLSTAYILWAPARIIRVKQVEDGERTKFFKLVEESA